MNNNCQHKNVNVLTSKAMTVVEYAYRKFSKHSAKDISVAYKFL